MCENGTFVQDTFLLFIALFRGVANILTSRVVRFFFCIFWSWEMLCAVWTNGAWSRRMNKTVRTFRAEPQRKRKLIVVAIILPISSAWCSSSWIVRFTKTIIAKSRSRPEGCRRSTQTRHIYNVNMLWHRLINYSMFVHNSATLHSLSQALFFFMSASNFKFGNSPRDLCSHMSHSNLAALLKTLSFSTIDMLSTSIRWWKMRQGRDEGSERALPHSRQSFTDADKSARAWMNAQSLNQKWN